MLRINNTLRTLDSKFRLPENLVTNNGTELVNNEIIALCHLYNTKSKHRNSHASLKNGLVEGMNRSFQEYLRCILDGDDKSTLNGQQI